ncbi:hypothetical protein M422DRAFT_133474, partial [Sphaerobolus stellatus SS14]
DKRNRFWSAYDRLSKETDEEFIERYNGDLDVQLIFAGLFSAVCSTFIVDLKSDLEPQPGDATNALLVLLLDTSLNRTVTPQNIALASIAQAPRLSHSELVAHSFAYASFSLSLFAAVCTVLGKQW